MAAASRTFATLLLQCQKRLCRRRAYIVQYVAPSVGDSGMRIDTSRRAHVWPGLESGHHHSSETDASSPSLRRCSRTPRRVAPRARRMQAGLAIGCLFPKSSNERGRKLSTLAPCRPAGVVLLHRLRVSPSADVVAGAGPARTSSPPSARSSHLIIIACRLAADRQRRAAGCVVSA